MNMNHVTLNGKTLYYNEHKVWINNEVVYNGTTVTMAVLIILSK